MQLMLLCYVEEMLDEVPWGNSRGKEDELLGEHWIPGKTIHGGMGYYVWWLDFHRGCELMTNPKRPENIQRL